VVSLSTDRFAISSPWLAVSVIVVLAAAVATLLAMKMPLKDRLLRLAAVAALVALPFCVEAVSAVVVLRSMFYYPVVLIVLASVASMGIALLPHRPRIGVEFAVASVVVLAVVGNATVTNRSFSIAATTYAMDTDLAFQIGQQKDLLLDGDNLADLPVVVSGVHSWPQGEFTTVRETLGLSLFSFNPSRTAKFLRAHGVMVHEASPDQVTGVDTALSTMPTYPAPGWVAVEDGVLILNFDGESVPAE
jgi:hypothetical protein